jgi:hypothetical protein
MKHYLTSYTDFNTCFARVNDILEYPDGTKAKLIFKSTDYLNGYYLTQVQTVNIKKDGTIGKLTNWLKFRHYETINKEITQ